LVDPRLINSRYKYYLILEISVKLRPLAQLFVALEFNASKYYKYSCGLNFRAPRFDLKLLVLQRSRAAFFDKGQPLIMAIFLVVFSRDFFES
jgi:hypothetical protein